MNNINNYCRPPYCTSNIIEGSTRPCPECKTEAFADAFDILFAPEHEKGNKRQNSYNYKILQQTSMGALTRLFLLRESDQELI